MAFNWQTFQTRTLTATVFVAVMLTGLLWNQWSFFILFSIIHFGCWWEYQKLVGLIDRGYQQINRFHKYGVMIAGWCLMLCFANETFSIGNFKFQEIGKWAGAILLTAIIVSDILFVKIKRPKNIGHSVFGLVYISLSWGLMLNLYRSFDIHIQDTMFVTSFNFIPIVIIASIWINDTLAYIVGSLIGKRPLSEISPKKTWEGTVGGIILSVAVMGLSFTKIFYSFSFLSINVLVTVIALIAAIFGTFGDLLESKLKRLAGVKDSGHIMPGHGGFLDRFDSMLLAIPVVWLFVYFFPG